MMSRREILFSILQFLDEEKFKKTAHELEKESGLFFNMRYFEDAVTHGKWEEAEKYLSGFTKVEDNRHSTKIFFELRKNKYLEALDRRDRARAVKILENELKVFSAEYEELYKEMTMLLTLSDIRKNPQLNDYVDARSARTKVRIGLKELIEKNPLLHDKLQFPSLKNSRLRTLINHSCVQQNRPRAPAPATNYSLMRPVPYHDPAITCSLDEFLATPFSLPQQAVSLGTTPPINAADFGEAIASIFRLPDTAPQQETPPINPADYGEAISRDGDYQTADYGEAISRMYQLPDTEEGAGSSNGAGDQSST